MPDKPETNGQLMSRLIRETPANHQRQAMTDRIRRDWKNPTPKTQKENDRG